MRYAINFRPYLASLLIALLIVTTASAKLIHADIQISGNTYRYQFEANIAAPFDATRAIVTDYAHFKEVNDGVVESRILKTYADGTLKRKLWVEKCVLIFCFDLIFIEKVEENGLEEIVTTIIPEESNFHRGVATWQIEAIDQYRTRIRVVAEQEPRFWIPPVIGPAIIKRVFRKEIEKTTKNIEHAAIKLTVDG